MLLLLLRVSNSTPSALLLLGMLLGIMLQVQDMYAAALAEDPNAFEYDSLYDSMQEQKAAPKQQEKLARQPKYIASLLEQAEVRKREQGITFERMLVSDTCMCCCRPCWTISQHRWPLHRFGLTSSERPTRLCLSDACLAQRRCLTHALCLLLANPAGYPLRFG